ncbi:hypothetical protein M422DRAFT_182788 [Sphaerobolus stellatus SS14]|uniref:Uncharacterized protein n=1 Tax=Sphaerobolus stellatus (strain SS14) TaxID=990650 RepID=A0A0C9UGE0_SPHS4|nr:hypothetical protein M422DRAFT_182788 [Sphaerobolus stellatus SS14]
MPRFLPNVDVRPQLEELRSLLDNDNGPILASNTVSGQLAEILHNLRNLRTSVSRPDNRNINPLERTSNSLPPANISSILPEPEVEYNVKITQRILLSKLYKYPKGSYLEYPETSPDDKTYIGHLFHWEGDMNSPVGSIVYSQGPPKGQTKKGNPAKINLFQDSNGEKVDCVKINSTCQGSKICPLVPVVIKKASHTKATRELLTERLRWDAIVRSMSGGPTRTILQRTLAYLNVLRLRGCGFPLQEETLLSAAEEEEWEARMQVQLEARRGRELEPQCRGRLLYLHDKDRTPFIWLLSGAYIEAYFFNDEDEMQTIDEAASDYGFGPLAPCMTVENSSSQRLYCPADHRDEEGNLTTLQLERTFCNSRLLLYIPTEDFISVCPYILVVCVGPHEHPIPIPSKTPPTIKEQVLDMVRRMDLDIADATPRRMMRHPAVYTRIRELCPDMENPTLIDIHPSLANKDHLRVYVNQIKSDIYPEGTDWNGVRHYKELQDKKKSFEDHYVRFIGTFSKVDGSYLGEDTVEECIRLIICMFPESSHRLLRNNYLQSDIAFSRLTNYMEFELGGWDSETRVSVCYCRIFLNCQSAISHFLVFRKIHQIVKQDTGQGLQWRHLHSETLQNPVGIFSFSVDQHLGQAQGLGLYLQELAQSPELRLKRDLHQPHKVLGDLTEYEHLQRFLRLCVNHMKRKVREGNKFPEHVQQLMYSLACIQHADWDGTIAAIQQEGGKAAIDWVQNKIVSKFPFPALCWQLSFIPLPIWQAGDRHTNLIETLHADINREGKFCTALSALIKSERFDLLKLKAMSNHEELGIRVSYKTGLDRERALHNIKREQHLRIKTQQKDDIRIQKVNGTLFNASQNVAAAKRRLDETDPPHAAQSGGSTTARVALQASLTRAEVAYAKALKSAEDLHRRGSGQIPLITTSQALFPPASASTLYSPTVPRSSTHTQGRLAPPPTTQPQDSQSSLQLHQDPQWFWEDTSETTESWYHWL